MSARWTPVAVVIGVLAAVLAGAGVIALVADDDDDRPAVESVTGADATSTTLDPGAVTTTTPAEPTTTSSPATTAGATSTTRRSTTTTIRPTTTLGRATTTTSARLPCLAGQVAVSTSTDSTSYASGQPVTLRTTLRNPSGAPCFYQGFEVTMQFLDPAGRPLVGSVVHADAFAFRPFAPGQSFSETSTWDPRTCQTPPCPLPPGGIYAAQAIWKFSGGTYEAVMQFLVRPPA